MVTTDEVDETPEHRPGAKLAVAGLILSLTVSIVGLTVSIIALVVSLRARQRNPTAIAGIILGVLGTAVFFLALWYLMQLLTGQTGPCARLGPGTHGEGIMTFDCPG